MILSKLFYFVALANVVLVQSSFKIRNKKIYEQGNVPYCITTKTDQAIVMLVAKPCRDDHEGQNFLADSQGRLVSKKYNTCIISRKRFVRLGDCSTPEDVSDSTRYVYQTMDGALGFFNQTAVHYIITVDSTPVEDMKLLRLRVRNYNREAFKWEIVPN